MKTSVKMLAVAGTVLAALSAPAWADYAFSGSGTSGTLRGGPGEQWAFNADNAQVQDDWGSPGVNLGFAAYDGPHTAIGFEITFTGGEGWAIDYSGAGLATDCGGGSLGGIVYCNEFNGLGSGTQWTPSVQTATTIEFDAPNAGSDQAAGQQYFTNVFFAHTGGAYVAPTGFTGRWIFSDCVTNCPEPASLSLIGVGLAGVAAIRRRRRQNKALATA